MNNPSVFKLLAVLAFCLMLLACSHTKEVELPEPQIKAGVAKITGRINGPRFTTSSMVLGFGNPVTAEMSIIETPLEPDRTPSHSEWNEVE